MFDTLLFSSVHSNLEHRLVTLTESLSPLKCESDNHLDEIQMRSVAQAT